MITNNVISLAEQAISSLLITNLKATVAKDQVYISDNDEIKQPMPYVIVHAESAEEQVTPGCGLYLVSIKDSRELCVCDGMISVIAVYEERTVHCFIR